MVDGSTPAEVAADAGRGRAGARRDARLPGRPARRHARPCAAPRPRPRHARRRPPRRRPARPATRPAAPAPGRAAPAPTGAGLTADRTAAAHPGAAAAPAPFTPRRRPGSRRSGTGLSVRPARRCATAGAWSSWSLLLVVVVGRLAVLQGVDGARLRRGGRSRTGCTPTRSRRCAGRSSTRKGRPLAYTVDASRVVADPTVVRDPAAHRAGAVPAARRPRRRPDRQAVAAQPLRRAGHARSPRRPPTPIEDAAAGRHLLRGRPGAALPGRRRSAARWSASSTAQRHRAGRASSTRSRTSSPARRAAAGRGRQRRQPHPVGHRRVHAGRRRRHGARSPSTRTCSTSLDQRLAPACQDGATARGLRRRPRRAHRPGARPWAPAPATTPATTRRPTRTCWATPRSPTSSSPAR